MTIDITALRRVAEAATPGPWVAFDDIDYAAVMRHNREKSSLRVARIWGEDDGEGPDAAALADASFIATLDPPTVIALLDEIASLRDRLAGQTAGHEEQP